MMHKVIVGVDEVGRGPLFGPVVAAAVVFAADFDIKAHLPTITDSKKLSPKQRENLDIAIKQHALAYSIASASVAEIDKINILQASLLAMQRCVEQLILKNFEVMVLIDGNKAPNIAYPYQTIIQGDLIEPAISAAAIVAKVHRDNLIKELSVNFPHYDLANNKGYPTKKHLLALQKYGITKYHRKTFAPIAKLISI